jgi:hypothetical protein
MNQSFLEINLKAVSCFNKELAEKISSRNELEAGYEFKEARSGDLIIYFKGNPMDDSVDPVWDAMEKYAKLEDKSSKNITIIFGMGLGYLFKIFCQKHKGIIIVFEPNLDLLRIALEVTDFSNILKNSNVRIANTHDDLEKSYKELYFSKYTMNLIYNKYFEKTSDEDVFKHREKIDALHGIYYSNFRNGFLKTSYWTKNLIENFPGIVKTCDLDILKKKFRDKCAVIISAGPSLDKNIQELKPYRDKIIVFCVGTALKTTIKRGIIPDFVVAIDFNSCQHKQLKNIDLSEINMILDTSVFPEMYRIKSKRVFNYYPHFMAQWLASNLGISMEGYKTMGTVSITALFSARMLGCREVILIGQDLAYTDGQCYSKDSSYGNYKIQGKTVEILANEENKEMVTTLVEDPGHIQHLGKDVFLIKGHNGKFVPTRPDFYMFIKYFEEIAIKYGHEIKLINSTEGGAYIEGFEHMPLKHALETYSKEDICFEEVINELKFCSKEILIRKSKVFLALRKVLSDWNKVKETVKNTVESIILLSLPQEEVELFSNIGENYPKYLKLQDDSYIVIENTEEDKNFITEAKSNIKNFLSFYKNHIENLSKDNFDEFTRCLNILKQNYLRIIGPIQGNMILRNFMIGPLLEMEDRLKHAEAEEKYLKTLYYEFMYVFIILYWEYPQRIRFIREIIQKMEE